MQRAVTPEKIEGLFYTFIISHEESIYEIAKTFLLGLRLYVPVNNFTVMSDGCKNVTHPVTYPRTSQRQYAPPIVSKLEHENQYTR